jgi:hypothetical protein
MEHAPRNRASLERLRRRGLSIDTASITPDVPTRSALYSSAKKTYDMVVFATDCEPLRTIADSPTALHNDYPALARFIQAQIEHTDQRSRNTGPFGLPSG